ncbi:pleiotropic drug resistance ABC transporter [Dentipellis sp. KUC8613]|nr:pleiotropic drug resistance ABC transporter [Dentipellis sp. KUC8613]
MDPTPTTHVDIDHFDLAGVEELRRTFTKMSDNHRMSNDSDITLAVPDDDSPFDLEKALRLYVKKQAQSDIKARELGVLFQDLQVVGVGAASSHQSTLASVLDPRSLLEYFRKLRSPPLRNILSGFEGVVRPGEMLLVLGSPGSGCSTLLKTLTNQRAEYHSVKGEVFYDSFTPEQIAKHFRGDVIYCPEDDVHFPTLTVDETLRFAISMRTPRVRHDNISRDQYIRLLADACAAVFGLRHVKNTPVGDASIRGVSGGEKKRVSISEVMVSRALITAWDNSTRGLDSSTSLEFARALRLATGICRWSMIVSIYQAGEQIYDLFDKVCVIYEGRMAYFGPANRARQYFIDMGFQPAPRQTTADFVVAVTDPKARVARQGFEQSVPRTAAEFAERFLQSDIAKLNRQDMDAYRAECVGKSQRELAFKESAHAERARMMNKASPYTVSLPMQAKAALIRRVQILKGNYMLEAAQCMAFAVMSTVVGTMFLKTPTETSAYYSRGGVLFFALLFSIISAMAELPSLFAQRPIVARQHGSALYRPFIDAVARSLVDFPILAITMSIFSIILYFVVGLQRSAAQFFIFLLFTFLMSLTMKTMFRAMASVFRSPAPVQGFVGVILLGLVLFTGYTTPRSFIPGALRWISWLNPMYYGFEALMANEFRTLNGTCTTLIPQGPGYENVSLANQVCTTVGSLPGQMHVNGSAFIALSYGYHYSNLWRNFGICAAFCIAFFLVLFVASDINTSVAGQSSVLLFKRGSKAAFAEDSADRADEEKGQLHPPPSPTTPKQTTEGANAPMNDVFTWQHLEYTVPVGGEQKERKLLNDISGYVVPGKLTALMGESGAGKTTLLNVLAQRTTSGVITGDRLVNGHQLPADFQSQTGYVQQMDTHLALTTVREALLFSARLRQSPSVPLEEKEAYVDVVLQMCGLEPFADAIVGSLNVELRKRTTIGVELAAKPRLLLFLDEPTSGLDSQSAWSIMQFLKELAERGQAILCTIHQPSAELFTMFDRLLLLQKGGRTVYFGDLGENATTMLEYFNSAGARACGPLENPAEYMLDVIGAGATAKSATDWHGVWKNSSEAERVQRELAALATEGKGREMVQTQVHSEFSAPWSHQVIELIKREAQCHWRDPVYILSKLGLNILGGLIIGFTFYRAQNSIQGTQNKVFAIFLSTVISVPLAQQLLVKFIETRDVYEIRERPSRIYSWTALLTAQFLAELPLDIISASFYFICFYWDVGFQTDRAGYTYLLLSVMFPTYYLTLALAAAALAPNSQLAGLLYTFLYAIILAFNGVLQPFQLLGWWKWMYHLSPFTYLVEGLIGQAVGRQELSCAAVELVTVEPPQGSTCAQYLQAFMSFAGGYLNNPDATNACQFCPVRSSDTYLAQNFNIFYSNHWRNFGLLVAYISFNIAAIYALNYAFRIRRFNPLSLLKRN